jgi:hypothetical protein
MEDRITAELALLRRRCPSVEYRQDARWVKVSLYPLSEGWSRQTTDVAFQIPSAFPGTPPYGIYVPAGLRFNGDTPANYTEPASNQPPFGGTWGVFSWTPIDGQWRATADPSTGSNLSNWVSGFADRFAEGK